MKNNKLFKTVAAITSVLALGAVVAACGDDDGKSPSGPNEPDKYAVTYDYGTAVNAQGNAIPDVVISDVAEGDYTVSGPSVYQYINEQVNYIFSGWKVQGDDNVYLPNQTFELDNDVTFEAQWTCVNDVVYTAADKTDELMIVVINDKIATVVLANEQGTTNYTYFTYTQSGTAITATPVGGTPISGTFENGELTIDITIGQTTYEFGPEDAVEYTVTYSLNGGTGTLPVESDKAEGAKFNLAESTGLTKDGHVFDGWSDGTTKYAAGAEYTMPASNVTLTAQWKVARLFDQCSNAMLVYTSGTVVGQIMLYENGTGVVYIFNSDTYESVAYNYIEYTVGDGVFNITSAIADIDDPTPLIATPVVGTITDRNVGITLNVSSASYEFKNDLYKLSLTNNIPDSEDIVGYYPENTPYDLTSIEDANYTSVKVNGEVKDEAYCESFTTPAADTVVEYKYNIYTVIYKAGEGTGADFTDVTTSTSYRLLSNSTNAQFAREGYVFAGWTVNDTDYSATASITLSSETTEVVARWNKQHTICYAGVDDPGVTTNFDPITSTTKYTSTANYWLPYGEQQRFPNAAATYFNRAGYVLKGWTSSADDGTDKEGTVYAPGSKYTVTEDTTFTAVWERITYYSVTYALGGGTGTLPTETNKAEGEKFKLADGTGLTNGDKVFDGWHDGTNKYAAGAEYTMPAGNVTLTAQWKDPSTGGDAELTGTKTYTGTPSGINGNTNTIVINFDTNEITFYYKVAGEAKTITTTAEKREDGYFITGSSNSPFGLGELWVVVSADGTTVTVHDHFNGGPDEQQGGAFTLQA